MLGLLDRILRKDATGIRWCVSCPGCGMLRLLPVDMKFGEKFSLVPCPNRCGRGFSGRSFGRFGVWGKG